MVDPYFWSNRPLTLARLRDIVAKLRARGWGWGWTRLKKELRQPETTQGIAIRRVNVSLYGALLTVLMLLPALVFRLVGTRRRTLALFYDLDIASLTFDIVDYVMLAELERRRLRLDAVHVVIVPGRSGLLRQEAAHFDAVVNWDARWWRLYNLVIPMFALFPTVAGYTICSDRRHATMVRLLFPRAVHPPGYWPAFPIVPVRRLVFGAAREGRPVFPGVRIPDQALKFVDEWLAARAGGRKPVVISLRQYGYMPSRNSNVSAWVAFARRLDRSRYAPLFVQDVSAAMAATPPELEEFLVFREAPFNMILRGALYERAWLNICQAHGPTELMWYNERCRYAIFLTVGSSPETEAETLRGYGIEPGESPPFATPLQRWVWSADDLDAIERTFAEMEAAIARAESGQG
jgi:hypothetical protein